MMETMKMSKNKVSYNKIIEFPIYNINLNTHYNIMNLIKIVINKNIYNK